MIRTLSARTSARRTTLAIALAAMLAIALAGCAPQPPQRSPKVTEQATAMNGLQMRMSESLMARMAKLKAAGKFTPQLEFVTLHDNVIVFWVTGKPTVPEGIAAVTEVSNWNMQYQGSHYNELEIKDYVTAEPYGSSKLAFPTP